MFKLPKKNKLPTQSEIEQKLSVYGDFLLKRSMVSLGKEQYFISWVRSFFYDESSLKGRTWEEKLPQFLETLASKPQIAPWMVDQADQAVRLYFQNFDVAEKASATEACHPPTKKESGMYDSQTY